MLKSFVQTEIFPYDKDRKELLNYLNILEKTFITIKIKPFYTNKRKELVKAPKIFFLDNGFRNIILKNFQDIKNRQDKGSLYENFIASELIKTDITPKYWRTKSKAEVDFIIEKNDKVIPIEVKSNLKIPKITKSYASFLEKYNPKNGLILSENLFRDKDNLRFRPMFSISNALK